MGKSDVTGIAAIAGWGAVSAAGDGARALLDAVRSNRGALRESSRFAAGPYMTSRVGAVPDDVWDRLGEGEITPQGSCTFRLAHRALAEAARQASACLAGIDPRRVGMVLSTTKAEVNALGAFVAGDDGADPSRRHLLASRLLDDLAVTHQAGGPRQCVSVACISGLLAIQQGARLIRAGAAEAVFVVGVDVLSHFVMAGFSTLRSLDPAGCRPFDKDRQGLSLGEGAGALVLVKPDLVPAPLAVLTGWGVSNDANHLTGPSRDGSGLALAIERALRMAGQSPADIDYVNAHGTGTPYNDRMEALAFQTVFGARAPWIGASKGLLGHTLGAAGVIESVLCLAAARAGMMPGTPGFATPDPDAPVRLAAAPQSVAVRRILKTNAGFGGTNSAVIFESGGPP